MGFEKCDVYVSTNIIRNYDFHCTLAFSMGSTMHLFYEQNGHLCKFTQYDNSNTAVSIC